jgi:hypothetical protein
MATNLTPQILDIIITKITPKTVWYDLYRSGQSEKWKIPAGSTFDTSTLVVGQRYRVGSMVVLVLIRNRLTRKLVSRQRFDWVSAVVLVPKAKLVAQTGKQRKAREALDKMPLVDTGGLFNF